jgi:hypothetical protein
VVVVAVEGITKIWIRKLLSLSKQQLMGYDKLDNGCKGGIQGRIYRNALRWSEEEEGKKEEEEKRRKKEEKEEMSTLYPLPRLAVDHLQR